MNIEKLSTKCIEDKIKSINENIAEYEKDIITIKSQIYVLYLRHLISKCKSEIHKLEAELEWRRNNG